MKLKSIEKAVNAVCRTLGYAGAIWIVLLMLLICTDVFMRLFLDSPLLGVPELVMNSIAAIAYFTLSWTTMNDQHIRSTLILENAPNLRKGILNIFSHFLGTLLMAGIAIAQWKPMIFGVKILEYEGEGALRVPTYPVRIIIVVGSLLAMWQCVRQLIISIKSLRTGGKGNKSEEVIN